MVLLLSVTWLFILVLKPSNVIASSFSNIDFTHTKFTCSIINNFSTAKIDICFYFPYFFGLLIRIQNIL